MTDEEHRLSPMDHQGRMEVKDEEKQMQQRKLQSQNRKLTKREFGLITVIVLLAIVVCGLVAFIIAWFLWPRLSPNEGHNVLVTHKANALDSERLGSGTANMSNGIVDMTHESCTSLGCLRTGIYMLENINRSVDPCQDFWTYSCGGWLKRNPIPPSKNSYSLIEVIEQRLNKNILGLLETNIQRQGKRSSERKAKQLFAACMAEDAIEKEGKKHLLSAIRRLGGWPAIGLWSKEHVRKWKLAEPLRQIQLTHSISALFTWAVVADMKDSTHHVIQIFQGGLTLPDRDYYQKNYTDPSLVAFRKLLRDSALLLGASGAPASRFVHDVFSFEKKLAKISLPQSAPELLDPLKNYNKIKARELIALAPHIDWRSFFRHFPGVDLSTDVVVNNVAYITNLSRLLSSSYARMVQNYLVWRLIFTSSPYLSREFREAHLEMEQVVSGTQDHKPRWEKCIGVVNDNLGMAVSALFIHDFFPPEKKRNVEEMVQLIKQTFIKRLDNLDWMDKQTRKEAKKKARAMTYQIGYPEFVTNTSLVNKLYENYTLSESQRFFEMITNCTSAWVRDTISDLGRPVDKYGWKNVYPHTVNAYYSHTRNAMIFPAGMLQPPFYDKEFPPAVNFGAMAPVFGHEVTHGFDSSGAKFDLEGNLHRWWTNQSWETFWQKTNCVANYYNQFEFDGLNVNGNLTLPENIADIGGLILAYQSFKVWEKEHGRWQTIPGVNLTGDQAFFLSYGQSWCGSYRRERLREILLTDPHCPEIFRVKGPVAHVKEFADAFSCKENSPMNPVDKCSIW